MIGDIVKKLAQWKNRIKSVPRRVGVRYRGTIEAVCERALRRKDKTIMSADPKQVQQVALTLEATLAMSEHLPPGELLAMTFTHEELNSFVSYMRQLDHEYRTIRSVIDKKAADEAVSLSADSQEDPF